MICKVQAIGVFRTRDAPHRSSPVQHEHNRRRGAGARKQAMRSARLRGYRDRMLA